MKTLDQFVKAAPVNFEIAPAGEAVHSYKYYVQGKNCTLGVLFEDSVYIYFEWLLEDEAPADYRPEIRYKRWPKHEFTELLTTGVWEVVPTCPQLHSNRQPNRP